ncbi:MAG: hypothetical protein AMS15_06805 [Planctomycetes bacterium DG_23]|nr:MAG: hypothetical protein AMS15_06805 [Planctomycetes bacterium DG_23]
MCLRWQHRSRPLLGEVLYASKRIGEQVTRKDKRLRETLPGVNGSLRAALQLIICPDRPFGPDGPPIRDARMGGERVKRRLYGKGRVNRCRA